jgi:hypothetical protein
MNMRRYIIGIDLGTSNCAVAFLEPAQGASARVEDFQVSQLVRVGEVIGRSLLPSVVYLPFEGEFPPGALKLPWSSAPEAAQLPPPLLGELARWQGGRVPGRVITSAKSWLIHPGVDRQAPILPWGAPNDVPRLSPVAAQAELLRHLASAWDAAHEGALLAEQDVVLTIPASFDEAARALTLQAARDAGFDLAHLTLLEEPQAAFYDFTSRHRDALKDALADTRLVLVVDVGGGTTDFSLVRVAMLPEGPALQRLAVGDHLLLGGDNMDAALARLAETKLFPDGRRFSSAQWTQALGAARSSKETLLGQTPPPSSKVAIASSGSRLLGGTLSTELTREEVNAVVVDGFFPQVTSDAAPTQSKRGAVVELGLPFAQDPGITRHLVAFLRAHAHAGHVALGTVGEGTPASTLATEQTPPLPRPDAILLNGGVFNSPVLTSALVREVSALWPTSPPIRLLVNDSLDLAVARGAAYSGLARQALGQKIGGGAPRAYYVVVSTDGSRKGVCIVPRGLEEGEAVLLSERSFSLMLGRPVQFQLYSTTADRLDRPGDVVDLEDESFKALPPIHTILAGSAGPAADKTTVQVQLHTHLTEVGTIALSCVAGSQRWRLEFELKGIARAEQLSLTQPMPARFGDATLEVERVFGTKPLPVEPKDVKNLFRTLEKVLGPRESWSLPVLREIWTSLWAGAGKRRRSADHERVMFQLLGYALRPGLGYPLDAWRCEQTFAVFKDLVTNNGDQAVWAEFWVLWRRIAGGLTEAAHQHVWTTLKPHLLRKVPVGLPPPKEKLRGVQPLALEEMVRCAASMELIAAPEKVEFGTWIVSRLHAPDTAGGPWAWALGRLGARVPVHGATHRVIPSETATEWIELLLKLDAKRHDGAMFAVTQLARRTGDRSRDVEEDVRARVLEALDTARAGATWRAMVAQVVQLSAADEARALGDTLPVGLAL